MHPDTIRRLNQINHDFYAAVADHFDRTRGAAWPGWSALLPHLARLPRPFSLLDVGCGNGRFGVFLHSWLSPSAESPLLLHYHGLDFSAALLERARAALTGLPGMAVRIEPRDVLNDPLEDATYDLIVLFGLLHHIPGHATRRDLLRRLAARLNPGGLLVFACWRFYEQPDDRRRILPWPANLQARVEPGDYLLDWNTSGTPRYCHYTDDAEHAALVAAAGLPEIATYRADGRDGRANRYSILQK
jgi:SAM-dependent methyltransferase